MKGHSLQIGNLTDPGRVREENQDYLGYYTTLLGDLFIVCDGMGGPAGGQTASRLAVDQISHVFQSAGADANVQQTIEVAVLQANKMVYETSQSDSDLRGMGTTCVVALVQNDEMHFAHVGDSRIYLVRDGTAMPLTKDHSLVQQMIDKGGMTKPEAMNHPDRNIVTRALGIKREVEVEVNPEPVRLRDGDQVLLACDGLFSHVGDAEIGGIVSHAESVQAACTELVDLANERGGTDNITVQIAKVVDDYHPKGRNRRRLTIVGIAAGLALLVGSFLGYSSHNRNSETIAVATLAREQGNLGEAYELLSELIKQDDEDSQVRGEMRHLADSADSQGLILYSNRQFDKAGYYYDLARKAYGDLVDEKSVSRVESHVRNAGLMSKATRFHRDSLWTKNGAVSVYTQVLEEDREDTLAINALVSIGDELETQGRKHEEGAHYGRAKGRYEAALDIWKTLSGLPKDYAIRVEQSIRLIASCERKLEAKGRDPRPTGGKSAPAVSEPRGEKSGGSSIKVESPGVSGPSPKAEPEPPVRTEEAPEAMSVEKKKPLAESLADTVDAAKALEDDESGEGADVSASATPVDDGEVINSDMRNAANLGEEIYRPMQAWVMATLRHHLVFLKPNQTKHTAEEHSAIIYRIIDSNDDLSERNRVRAEKLKKIGVDEGLWSTKLESKAWPAPSTGTVEDTKRILIIVGKDHGRVFLSPPEAEKPSSKP